MKKNTQGTTNPHSDTSMKDIKAQAKPLLDMMREGKFTTLETAIVNGTITPDQLDTLSIRLQNKVHSTTNKFTTKDLNKFLVGAAISGCENIVRTLIASGANVDTCTNSFSSTPLHKRPDYQLLTNIIERTSQTPDPEKKSSYAAIAVMLIEGGASLQETTMGKYEEDQHYGWTQIQTKTAAETINDNRAQLPENVINAGKAAREAAARLQDKRITPSRQEAVKRSDTKISAASSSVAAPHPLPSAPPIEALKITPPPLRAEQLLPVAEAYDPVTGHSDAVYAGVAHVVSEQQTGNNASAIGTGYSMPAPTTPIMPDAPTAPIMPNAPTGPIRTGNSSTSHQDRLNEQRSRGTTAATTLPR